MALQLFARLWPLFQFLDFCTHSVGLLELGISPSQCRYVHTGQHKHRTNAHKYPCLKRDRTHDPSARAGEDSWCPRTRGHCGRHNSTLYEYNLSHWQQRKEQKVAVSWIHSFLLKVRQLSKIPVPVQHYRNLSTFRSSFLLCNWMRVVLHLLSFMLTIWAFIEPPKYLNITLREDAWSWWNDANVQFVFLGRCETEPFDTKAVNVALYQPRMIAERNGAFGARRVDRGDRSTLTNTAPAEVPPAEIPH
jgi:hypothetical protein